MTNKAKERTGNSNKAFYSLNEYMNFNYRIVDENTLIANNDDDGNNNLNYPARTKTEVQTKIWTQHGL